MITYNFPKIYELSFKFPPALIWRKKSLKVLERTLEAIAQRRNGNTVSLKILDVGCGAGILTPMLKKIYPSSEILGIDNSLSMINFAKCQYGELAKFKLIDFLDYEGKPASPIGRHDLILIFYSFCFFPLKKAIEKIKNLLNPDGICVIVTCGKAPFSMFHQFYTTKFLARLPFVGQGTKIWIYPPSDFYNLLSSKEFFLTWKLISEVEGSYIITIRQLTNKV
ncbi:class I SAM-dependent methyltransferase [candidate division WOR-3 bacterium]|nr:class I SAM-dependent methyltransferase [candidate division WOR-3 bacterium]